VKRLEDMTEPELGALLTAMAREIKAAAGRRGVEPPLFALVLFNDPRVGQYIGNCERPTMIRALRELADRLERREDVPRTYPDPAGAEGEQD
jgi:hypothetical protein